MKIECFLAEICGSCCRLRENIERALAELAVTAEVVSTTITYDEAVEKGVPGSPTVRINGRDVHETGGGSPGVT